MYLYPSLHEQPAVSRGQGDISVWGPLDCLKTYQVLPRPYSCMHNEDYRGPGDMGPSHQGNISARVLGVTMQNLLRHGTTRSPSVYNLSEMKYTESLR